MEKDKKEAQSKVTYVDQPSLVKLREAALAKIKEKVYERPILVFMREPDKAFEDELQTIAATALCKLHRISSFEEAQNTRDLVTGLCRDITILGNDLVRGYDYKLGKDAFVVVYGNNTSMTLWYASQAVGRGCRAMGSPRACVFVLTTGVATGGGKLILTTRITNDIFGGG